MSVVISSQFVLTDQAFPLNHARIGINSALVGATVTATSTATGFDPENVIDGTTYDYWRPTTGNATLTAVFTEIQEIDYLGIAAHDLGTAGASIQLQHYIDGAWTDTTDAYEPNQFDALATGDKTIMLFFNRVFTDRIRLVITSSQVYSVGVVYAGKAFAFERPFYQGHRPLSLNRTTSIVHHISEQGLDVGRYIRRKGARTTIQVNNQTPGFMRNKVAPLIQARRTKGFFFAWRPDSLPDDVAFCWSAENIQPVNSGKRDLMDLSFSVSAI